MSEIKPALTPEEWAAEDGRGAVDGGVMVYAPRGMDGLVIGPPGPGSGVLLPTDLYHATAAMALRGQPFGFTWEDVDEIRGMAGGAEALHDSDSEYYMDGGVYERFTRLYSLADRIAALLPPRKP